MSGRWQFFSNGTYGSSRHSGRRTFDGILLSLLLFSLFNGGATAYPCNAGEVFQPEERLCGDGLLWI